MKYTLTIEFPNGPTIMASDLVAVGITRMAGTPEELTKLQQAAIALGATTIEIIENKSRQ